MINQRFEEFVKMTVGEECFSKLRETKGYRLAMKVFDENVKPGFRGPDDEDQYVNFPMANIPDNPNRGVIANTITVTAYGLANQVEFMMLMKIRDNLYAIFLPVFEKIDRLIAEQIHTVRTKRVADGHPKGRSIKVSATYRSRAVSDRKRQSSWLAALVPICFSEIESVTHTQTFKSYSQMMRGGT